jgi:hypothetical protein
VGLLVLSIQATINSKFEHGEFLIMRLFLKRIIACALKISLGVGAIISPAFADDWQWIRVAPQAGDPNHLYWEILQGKDDVEIKDGRISAELKYHEEKDGVKYRYYFLIEGTVSAGGEVSVTEILENSDAAPHIFSGIFEITKDRDREYDRILLMGEPNFAAHFISLYRIVKR